jgi:hypothetical protein
MTRLSLLKFIIGTLMDSKCKAGMIDNRKVKDSHQEGISRVMQRKSEKMSADSAGHNGSMAGGWGKGAGSEKNWKRSGASLTPRKA